MDERRIHDVWPAINGTRSTLQPSQSVRLILLFSHVDQILTAGEKPPQANIAAFYNQAQLWFAYFCISWLWLSGAADTYICGRTTCQIQSEAIDIGLRKVPTWRSRSLDLLIVRLGWHINCRVRTSEQLSHVTSTSFQFPGCGFLVPSMALLARRIGQCPGSIAFIALGRWVTENFIFPSSLRLIYCSMNSRISARLTQSQSMELSSKNQWNLLVFSVRYFYLFYFDSKPLRCRWWCGQSEGDIWSMDFGAATRFYIVDRHSSPISCIFPIQRHSITSW